VNAREALDTLTRRVSGRAELSRAAVDVLRELIDVAGRCERGEVGAWRAALGAALAGEVYRSVVLAAATEHCRSTTVPCGFASCEVHYGRRGSGC